MASSRAWRRFRIAAAVVIAVAVVLVGVGSLLPRDHVARMTLDLQSPPDRVWPLIADVSQGARWRTDITGVRVEPGSAEQGRLRFVESSPSGDTPFEVLSEDAPRRRVVRVIDEGLPFGGTWTWELHAQGPGTHLVVEEAGFIKNPIFRVIAALFFKPTATMDAYLRALAKALGEQAEPREAAAEAR